MDKAQLQRIATIENERNRFLHGLGGKKVNMNEAALRRAERHDRIVAGFEQLFDFTKAKSWDDIRLITPRIGLERAGRQTLSVYLMTSAGAAALSVVRSDFYRNGCEMKERAERYAASPVVTVARAQGNSFYEYCRGQRKEDFVGFGVRLLEENDQIMHAAETTQAMIWDALRDEYLNPQFARRAEEVTPVITQPLGQG